MFETLSRWRFHQNHKMMFAGWLCGKLNMNKSLNSPSNAVYAEDCCRVLCRWYQTTSKVWPNIYRTARYTHWLHSPTWSSEATTDTTNAAEVEQTMCSSFWWLSLQAWKCLAFYGIILSLWSCRKFEKPELFFICKNMKFLVMLSEIEKLWSISLSFLGL